MLHAQLTFHKVYSPECLETLKKLNMLHSKSNDLGSALEITKEAYRLQQRTLDGNDPVLHQTTVMLENLRQQVSQQQKQQQQQKSPQGKNNKSR